MLLTDDIIFLADEMRAGVNAINAMLELWRQFLEFLSFILI